MLKSHGIITGLLILSLCACQNTLEGLGHDMQDNGKKLSDYSQKQHTNA